MLIFSIYSFLGFLMESVYVSILQKRWHFSGLLKGPFIPIYGFGACIILAVAPFCTNNFDLFFYSMVLCTFIEYLTHYFLHHDAHIKIWDYSCFSQNYANRICMFYTLMWGFLGIVLVNIIHPLILNIIALFDIEFLNILAFFYILWILYQFYNHPCWQQKMHDKINELS